MKKLLLFSFTAFVWFANIKAQVPNGFNYQGVARDTAGNLIFNQNIGLKISILMDSINGTSAYTETHSVTSDPFGVFSVVIGNGTIVLGNFSTIRWGSTNHFVKIEMDITGGNNYQLMGISQLLSVPYAMYADSAGKSRSIFNDSEFGIINKTSQAEPPANAPSVALAGTGAGNVDNGMHSYKVTFLTITGETTAGTASDSITVTFNGSNGKISLTGIPISSDSGVIGRNVYRRFHAAGSDYKFLTTINDNTSTNYIDNTSYSGLGGLPPAFDSTKVQFKLSASQLTDNRTYSLPDKSGTISLVEDFNANSSFGGDGSDGVLSVTSVVNIDLGGASLFVKNYQSISITGSGKITFSNPHPSGTLIIFRSQGNATISSIAPAIDISSIGASPGTKSTAILSDHLNDAGGVGISGGKPADILFPANNQSIKERYLRLYLLGVVGAPGAYGNKGGNGTGGTGGSGGSGGNGGGSILLEVGGSLTFTGSITANGSNGNNGGDATGTNSGGGGGGGGGSGGFCMIIYSTLISNTGSIIVNGGNGGNGGGGSSSAISGGIYSGGYGGGGGGSFRTYSGGNGGNGGCVSCTGGFGQVGGGTNGGSGGTSSTGNGNGGPGGGGGGGANGFSIILKY